MFQNLTERLSGILQKIRGQGRLTEDNIKDTLREVRRALLEADVALPVVRDFLAKVQERALGQEVLRSLTPGQIFVKVVHGELLAVLGAPAELQFNVQPPAVFLLAGLQGAGKTTTVAKLARFLKERLKKRVLVVSCDVYRPAAIEQLHTLAREDDVGFFPSDVSQDPVRIAQAAIQEARLKHLDVVLIDTAGRLHIDAKMMDEIKQLHAAVTPVETLFVVDSMTGQDAANSAKAFHEALPLTGVILTKTDGDARGGAALSVRAITGKPIKFLGTGEKSAALEPFYPDRLASRILGMGDVLSLVEEVERKIDRTQAEQLTQKMFKGKGLDLDDLRSQLMQLRQMGGMESLLDKLPGAATMPKALKDHDHDKDLRRRIAMINSMTLKERRFPDLIKGSRKQRIAQGSGTQVQDINRLLKEFEQMQKMMKMMGNPQKLKGLMRGLGGRTPPKRPF